MYRGELCEIGETEQVLARPSHPYTRKLLAAVEHMGRPPVAAAAPEPALAAPFEADALR